MTMFNNQGELNASSVKDAMNLLVKYASILEEGVPSNTALAGVSDDRTDELVSRAILTQDGKVALAQTMANPIRKYISYMN